MPKNVDFVPFELVFSSARWYFEGMKTRKNSFPIFGIRLSELCKKTKTRLKNLAALGQVSVVSAQKWTKSVNEPPYATLAAIARHFGVSSDYLLGLTDTPAPLPPSGCTAQECATTPPVAPLLASLPVATPAPPPAVPESETPASAAELLARLERVESRLARVLSATPERDKGGIA